MSEAVPGVMAGMGVVAAMAAFLSAPTGDAPSSTVVLHLRDARIAESSGLAASTRHPGILWTHNDSGDPARIFAVGPDGQTRGVVTLRGVQARDWEALAPGPDHTLWAGDVGDNDARRTRGVLVHRVVEPAHLGDATVSATSYRLRYPDGPHDAEALLVDPRDGRVYVVTKELFGGSVFAAPAPLVAGRPNVLRRIASAPPVITDGAFLPDGRLVLRSYSEGFLYAAFGRLVTTFPLPDQEQGESIAATTDRGIVLVGSEGKNAAV